MTSPSEPPPPPHKVQAHSFSRCAKVAPFCVGDFLLYLYVDDARASAQCCTRCGSRQEAARATVTPVPSARTANRRHALGREPRKQSRARSGGWERGVLHGQVPENPTPQVAGMDVHEVPATGSRPDRLAGVRPQERVQQHPVDQIVDTAPAMPILDVPVPLMGEQLVDVLRFFNTLCPVAEQVIDVPKISLEDIPARRLCRVPQLVEQLVEVPTVVPYLSFLQRTVEQTVDNPASHGRGLRGGIEGFFPGQGSTPAVVCFPVPRGDLQGFLPGQGSLASSSSLIAANEAGQGGFRTFPHGKKCGVPGRIFWEMTSGIISTCSALGSTVDICMASVYEVMASFTYFLHECELGS